MSDHISLFDTLALEGTDRGFAPRITSDFGPTRAPAGSQEKIDVLRWRLEHGFPLWHQLDGAPAPDRGRHSRRVARRDHSPSSDSFS
jgi:hypothetical protein